ncbi:MAG: type II pantothenate kinase [Proteobacteria bacterium]|nr:MAG: type II pantothenate kinase [Pseudomonadota bacterium]
MSVAIGVDWGATLAKIAVRAPDGALAYRLLPTEDAEASRATLVSIGADRIGLTGGGASMLARSLPGEVVQVNEFAAWGAGASALLADGARRYLLVSIGTGTSVLLVDGVSVTRVGGTALGGGTLIGLAAGLLGEADFEAIARLASRGSRREVDLLVSDIYPAGGIALAGDLTASNFGKFARRLREGPVDRADVAHAIMGLLAENIVLVCTGLAVAAQVTRVVFGGSTLRHNATLADMIGGLLRAYGREPVFLTQGEFTGALGALRIALGQ